MTHRFVTLRRLETKKYLVTKNEFNLKVGDEIIINGIKYRAIFTGTRSDCTVVKSFYYLHTV